MISISTAGTVVDGVRAEQVAKAHSVAEVAAILADPERYGRHVVARGAGTKLDWGLAPERLDTVLDLSGLEQLIEHRPGDLVVHVQAGMRLDTLQRELARAGQRLAIDEVITGSTIGGIIATGLAGPLRHHYGSVRDLLIGLTVVRADGAITHAGGQVVKNVAGYDLCKLYTGSYGTLGIIAEAILRVHPLPQARAVVIASYTTADKLNESLMALTSTQLAPVAIELSRLPGEQRVELAVALEGSTKGVATRAQQLHALLGSPHEFDEQPHWWTGLPGESTAKCSVPLSALGEFIFEIGRDNLLASTAPALRASGGLGIVHVGLDGALEPSIAAQSLERLRELSTAQGGHLVVLRAPLEVKALVDVWGHVASLDLMQAVKHNFDPERRLAPGRFVGGI